MIKSILDNWMGIMPTNSPNAIYIDKVILYDHIVFRKCGHICTKTNTDKLCCDCGNKPRCKTCERRGR